MSIEFRCTACDKLLRTPEGSEGRKAKCPQCGSISVVPGEREPEPAAVSAPSAVDERLFRTPATDETMTWSPPAADVVRPVRLDLREVLSRAWKIFNANFVRLAGVAFLVHALAVLPTVLLQFRFSPLDMSTYLLVAGLLIAALGANLGMLRYALNIARGEPASLADVASGMGQLLPAAGISSLAGGAFLLGSLFLFVPGVIALLMFSQAFFVLVDRRSGVLESLRLSAQITRGNRLTLLALFCVGAGLSMLGMVVFLVGFVLVHAYMLVAAAVAYLMMTGQKVADPSREGEASVEPAQATS